jgi:Zn-dependent protease/CBS domain-containing protein
MKGHIRLGRVLGVDIALHYSWFLIALLITLSLGATFGEAESGFGSNPLILWTSAVFTGLLFFGTLVLHELAHVLAAQHAGLPVRSVTLFALGGVSDVQGEPERPGTEFWIGVVGPLTSLVIGVVCLGLARVLGWSAPGQPSTAATAILVWLGGVNLLLALFNMLPGYPLDGGRVLRSLLWKIGEDRGRATRQAAAVGQAVAIFLIAFGLLQFFTGAGFDGLWLAFIGWFLLSAASTSSRAVTAAESLRGLNVADAMSADCGRVGGERSVQDFVVQELLRAGRRCFVVEDGHGHVAGLVTLHEIKSVPRKQWNEKQVRDIMRPLDSLKTVNPADPLSDSLQLMSLEDVHQLPVLENGRLLGVLTRGDVLRVLQVRQELAAST